MRARYYCPDLRRFINADIVAGDISNAITLNRYAYANGNPVSNIDPFGLSAERGGDENNKSIWELFVDFFEQLLELYLTNNTYSSAHEAAEAFYEEIYYASAYVRHEFGAFIYEMSYKGNDYYGYSSTIVGSPHEILIHKPTTDMIIAVAHTHWISGSFSGRNSDATSGDIPASKAFNIDCYLVGPDLSMYRYDVSDDNIYWEGFIIPEPLTNDQKKELEEQFHDLWYGHFENGICPKAIADPSKCNPDLLWPNEEAINLFDY